MRKKIEVNVRIRIKSNQSIVKNIDRSIDRWWRYGSIY